MKTFVTSLFLFFATGLVGQEELKFSGGESFAPGQFVALKFDIDKSTQPLLLIAEPVDLEHASHSVDGKLVFYTSMPKQSVVMWVLLQKAVNGTIETTKHQIVLKPDGFIPEPTPDPKPSISEAAKPYCDQLLLIKDKVSSSDCKKIHDIFINQSKVDQDVQSLINNTFSEVAGIIVTDVQKTAWMPFFDWLEIHLKEKSIAVAEKKKYIAIWLNIAEAFDAVSKS